MIGDKPFRKLDSRSWDVLRRLADMDEDGVTIQVLSPMPELLSYWLPSAAASLMCDLINNQIAEMIAQAPKRLRGLGAVPLGDVTTAVAYLPRIRTEFGLSGVEIGSNINGVLPGDPSFDPFYAAVQALELAVFVHALHPVAAKAVNATPVSTAFAYFPIDVAMAASSVMMNGLLDRFPTLRIGFSHGGGAIGAMLGRLDTGWEATAGYHGAARTRPSDVAKKLFFDSNVLDRGYLHYLVSRVAPGHVFIGTDYPYDIRQVDPSGFVEESDLSDAQRVSLRHAAAEEFLHESLGLTMGGTAEMAERAFWPQVGTPVGPGKSA